VEAFDELLTVDITPVLGPGIPEVDVPVDDEVLLAVFLVHAGLLVGLPYPLEPISPFNVKIVPQRVYINVTGGFSNSAGIRSEAGQVTVNFTAMLEGH
jgi:hypothetical protein